VLIDEYDAPILNKITNIDLADKIREALRSFHGALKDASNWRGFTFITGITKFSKTSIFSTLNNLRDLTLTDDYVDICGLTMENFDCFFEDQMTDHDLETPTLPVKLKNLFLKANCPKVPPRMILKTKFLSGTMATPGTANRVY
jgi:hypothetical protein